MASKGIVRTGEAYCLSCHQEVDSNAAKCPGCYSELTDEVKAFKCPKCQQVVALGDAQCSKCGLKFKVKILKAKEPAQDDQFLSKLIEWGKPPSAALTSDVGTTARTAGQPAGPLLQPGSSQLSRLTQLKESIDELMKNRSEMLDRMEKRMESEKARLARIESMSGQDSGSEQVEAEIMSLADEMADITMLQAHMEYLSDEISNLMESVDVTGEAKERGLAARALRMKLDAKEKELSELRSREELLAKKDEMIEQKLQAYAAKKKQLDQVEEDLKQKLSRLEEERAQIEALKAGATGAKTEFDREEAKKAWVDEQAKAKQMLLEVKSRIHEHMTGMAPTDREVVDADTDLTIMIAEIESQIADLIVQKAEIQQRISETTIVDEDLRRLLKVLDQLLVQLPEEAIDKFSKSDEFALYERVLEKLRI